VEVHADLDEDLGQFSQPRGGAGGQGDNALVGGGVDDGHAAVGGAFAGVVHKGLAPLAAVACEDCTQKGSTHDVADRGEGEGGLVWGRGEGGGLNLW